jgi:hypothetical protein
MNTIRDLEAAGLLKEVSPSLYHVVDTPLVILLLPNGGWQVYYDHPSGERVPCFDEPRASLELAAFDAFRALEITRPMATKLPILPHPAPEATGGVAVIRPSAQNPTEAALLPAPVDEQCMIDTVAAMLSGLRSRIEKEWSPEFCLQLILNGLRSERPEFAILAIQNADRGDEFVHSALRIVYFEMEGGAFPGWGPWHVHIKEYGMRAVVRPDAPRRHRRGRRWVENWVRNFHICGYVLWTCDRFGLHPTRNRAAQGRAGSRPSGISIVMAALTRAKIAHPTEATVLEHIWKGLPGEIVREAFSLPRR